MAPAHPLNGQLVAFPQKLLKGGCIAQKRFFFYHYSYLGTPAPMSRTRAVHTAQGTQDTHRAAHPSVLEERQNEPWLISLAKCYAFSFPKINIMKAQA